MSDQHKREDPQFKVNSRDDLAELLDRAGNWAERDVGADVIAAEFRQARDFVEDEIQDEPELVTDGGVDQGESEVEHVSIMEYNENAEKQGREPGERVIVGGHRRNTHVRDDEIEGFVEVAEAVAIIELHKPIAEDEVTDWCNSQAGKLALAPFAGNYEPEEVIDTGSAAKKRAMTDGGEEVETEAEQKAKIIIRHADRQTARQLIDDMTELGIKREAIQYEP